MTESTDDAIEAPRDATVESESQEASLFRPVFVQYGASMTAIREFFSQLAPFVSEIEEGRWKSIEEQTRTIMQGFMERATKQDSEELTDVLKVIVDRISGVKSSRPKRITASGTVTKVVWEIGRMMMHTYSPGMHQELLNRSILMSLVSYFEVLVSDLAHLYYRLVPDATSADEKALSVNDLRQFKSIDDALQSVVSRRVDNLLREGADEWHRFFKTRMKIDLDQLVPSASEWREFFQRRHIIVHACGRVTERYLASVDWDSLERAQPTIGTALPLDGSYLARAIDAFEIAGLLLCQEIWRKLAPQELQVRLNSSTGLCDAVYRRLKSGNWCVAEHLASWGLRDGYASEDVVLICRFNTWLCMKRQGRWEEAVEEVEAFDCAAKHPKYALVKAALLERPEEFFNLLRVAVGAGVDEGSLQEWPILDEMRRDPRFAEVVAEHRKALT